MPSQQGNVDPSPFAASAPRYAAFVSYKRGCPDEWVARFLRWRIENHRLPRNVTVDATKFAPTRQGQFKFDPRRPLRRTLFLDREEVNSGGVLGDELRASLQGSRFMILLCSPRSAESQFVRAELAAFRQVRSAGSVVPVCLNMTATDALHTFGLRNGTGELGAEPVAIELGYGSFLSLLWRAERRRLPIVATLLGVPYADLYARHLRDAKRRLFAAVSLACVVVIVLATALVDATIQRRRADRNLEAALTTVDLISTTISRELAKVPGTSLARAQLIEAAAQLHRLVGGDMPDDTRVKRGDVELATNRAMAAETSGDHGAATREIVRAEELATSIRREAPASIQARLDLARVLMTAAGVLGQDEDGTAAEARLLQAREELLSLEREAGEAEGVNFDLARCAARLAVLRQSQQRAEDARRECAEATRRINDELRRDPANERVRYESAGLDILRGDLAMDARNASEAEASYRTALESLRDIPPSFRDDALHLRRLARALLKLGHAKELEGNRKDALECLRDSIDLHRRIAEANSGDVADQIAYALACFDYATGLADSGPATDALPWLETSVTTLDRALVRAPEHHDLAARAYEARCMIARVRFLAGDTDAAEQAARAADEFDAAHTATLDDSGSTALVRANQALVHAMLALARNDTHALQRWSNSARAILERYRTAPGARVDAEFRDAYLVAAFLTLGAAGTVDELSASIPETYSLIEEVERIDPTQRSFYYYSNMLKLYGRVLLSARNGATVPRAQLEHVATGFQDTWAALERRNELDRLDDLPYHRKLLEMARRYP